GTTVESTTMPKSMHDDDGAGAASGSGRFPGAAPVSSFYDSDSIKRWHLSAQQRLCRSPQQRESYKI
ncbi:hypothetical protein M514_10476, partial [Trichuris suis]